MSSELRKQAVVLWLLQCELKKLLPRLFIAVLLMEVSVPTEHFLGVLLTCFSPNDKVSDDSLFNYVSYPSITVSDSVFLLC